MSQKVFSFKSGTEVRINERDMEIIREGGKSAAKALFMGRTSGRMTIALDKISGIVYDADYLMVCASGLPMPADFKIGNTSDIKQYPNCIVAKSGELEELYNYLRECL